MARTIVWLLVSTIAGGCLAHERPIVDDAGTDAHVAIDARAPDVGHDAFAPDTNEPDAFVAVCDVDIGIPSGCMEWPNLNLPELSCSTSGAQCVQLEVDGRDSLADMRQGALLIVSRCAPDSQETTVRVTVLEAPTGGAGLATYASGLCNGEGRTPMPMALGDTVELHGGSWPQYNVDRFSFFGEGTRYAVEACAYAPCP